MIKAINNKPTYQLSSYPVGSIGEIWTVSWPLILSLLSMSIMLFTDRLLLSRYSVSALDAAAGSGTAAYAFIVLPMAIASISEVFVGRFHGDMHLNDIGRPVWQMIWFSIFLTPFFIAIAYFMPPLLFAGSSLINEETNYFFYLMIFTPFFCINSAIVGFFAGTGRVKTVTLSTFASYALNILLDYLFIFGFGPIPEGGVTGAVLATGISEIFNIIVLGSIMFKKSHRLKYGTAKYSLDASLFLESIKVGFPSGVGGAIEIVALFIFFKIMSFAGSIELTIAAVVQSVYFLIMFLYHGLSKGVTAVSANLLGGKQYNKIHDLIKSAFKLQIVFSLFIGLTTFFLSHQIIDLFFNDVDQSLLNFQHIDQKVRWCFLFMCAFFLFDGLGRIIIGHLIAAGDTRFILYTGTVLTLIAYILPTFAVVYFLEGGAQEGWLILATFSINMLIVYTFRYRSHRWLKTSMQLDKSAIDNA